MFQFRSILTIFVLCVCAAFAGCRANGNPFGSQNQSGNSSVVLAVTDTPPSNVSILSAEVTLTGATLTPGNVSIFSGSTTIELTKLQTDVAYLATAANVPAGAYTGVILTFANPMLTIENDTNAAPSEAAPWARFAPSRRPRSQTCRPPHRWKWLPSRPTAPPGFCSTSILDNLLSATLGADFKNGVTASPFIPAGAGAPLVGAEDVVGQVTSLDAAHNSFTFQNANGTFSLAVDGSTTFFQVPASTCTITGFSGIHVNQILSVDIGIHADGTLGAHNVLCEDSDNSDTEVEGMITATNVGQQQFSIVTLGESASVSGLQIGDVATVHYSAAPQTPFDVDFAHADTVQVSTAGFLFAAPTDLSVGQQVSIRRNASSSGNSITADRVRLRSSRISANVQSVGAPNINLGSIPSIFSGHGVTQIQVQTSAQTILSENNAAIVFTQISGFRPDFRARAAV